MNRIFKLSTIRVALCLAYPALILPALAAEPYPALPPTLSTAVTPNILLHIDNSGSMDDYPPTGGSKRKMAIARDVAKELIDENKALRWGLFSFDPSSNATGGILRAPVGSTQATLNTAIDGLSAETWTPLGEAMFEITRYWAGETSYYDKISGNYTSPIQYRCQKNFNIVITDGVSTKDNWIPGLPASPTGVSYTSYDAAGNAVSPAKIFKACVNKDTVSSVTCPEKLEGSTVNNAFVGTSDDSSSYGRTIRDVAMYAYDKDMRVGGNDLDGKSFDDPKFKLQNVATYTVGFAINDPVLKAAATVGFGKYYTADNEEQLTDALADAVNSIIASISNAGGVATQSEATAAGNKVFQPVFNPKGWYGELRCFNLDTVTGDVGAACSPQAKAVIPAYASRKLHSAKFVSGVFSAFDFNPAGDTTGATTRGFMTSNTSPLGQRQQIGSDNTERNNVIRFLRGEQGIAGFRTRPNGLLGDIIDGQPVVVSRPSGMTTDTSYAAFSTANASRGIVLVGANDGMLHAFRISDMNELMGYIPSAVYPRLKALSALDYGVSSGTPHTFHVNGTMRQQDVKLGTTPAWKTIVVGGLAQGGQGFFAVDATNEAALTGSASTAVKWEWTDQKDADMGYAFAAPLIYNVRTSATAVIPAVILANGYESNYDDVNFLGGQKSTAKSSALYIVNADTGALIKKIPVPGGAGLSSPAGVDFGQDGILDYVYAGDMNGKLWRFDLTDPANFKVVTTPIFDAGPTHPIVMRPAIKPVTRPSDGVSLGNLVLFGTGKLLTDADRTDVTTQSFYAVLDDMASAPVTVPKTDLVGRTVEATATINDTGYRTGSYRKVSSTPDLDLTATTNTKKGWYLDFPVSTERLVTSPMLYDDKLLFGTGITQSDEKCLPGGKGWVMGLNPMTGSVTKSLLGREFSFVDVKLDGRSTDADQILFPAITNPEFVNGFSKDGIPTELTYVAASSKIVTTDSTGSTLGNVGAVIALREANTMAVYTGNAAAGVSRGTSMSRPASSGVGNLYSGTIGDDKVGKEKLLGPGSAVRIESTIWREIK